MKNEEQMDALYNDLARVLIRFKQEFDLKGPDIVWVLECLVHDVSDVCLDFEADLGDSEEEEEDE